MKEGDYPYQCPSCKNNLSEKGAVIVWREIPERIVGHATPGAEDGIIFMVDEMPSNPPIQVECADCSDELKLPIEDFLLDPECDVGNNIDNENLIQAE